MAAAVGQHLDLDFDLERDGCPWGWATSRFVTDLASYMGTRGISSPIRTRSLRLERRMLRDAEEPLELFWLVRRAELWEDSAYNKYNEVLSRG